MSPLSTIPSVNYSFFQCMSRQPDMVKKEGIFNPLLPLSRKAQLMCLLLWIIWTRRYLQTRWLLMSLCNLCQCIEGGDKQSLRRRELWRWEDRTSLRGELRESFRKTEKVCPGERKTSPPKCLLFHAFFRIAYIATTRWMNNKCMFALPSFLTTYFATNRWVGRAYKEESPAVERRQNCSTTGKAQKNNQKYAAIAKTCHKTTNCHPPHPSRDAPPLAGVRGRQPLKAGS